jgi:hypothetical protein
MAPIAVEITTPNTYQVPRNTPVISGQCSAYIVAALVPASSPAPPPASHGRVGAKPLAAHKLVPKTGSDNKTMFNEQVFQVPINTIPGRISVGADNISKKALPTASKSRTNKIVGVFAIREPGIDS